MTMASYMLKTQVRGFDEQFEKYTMHRRTHTNKVDMGKSVGKFQRYVALV